MPRELTDPRQLLVVIAKLLKKLKVPYIITGGMAVFIWGRPRFTADIDIVVELKYEDIDVLERALMALGKSGYVDKNVMREALENSGEFNFIDGNTGVKVDFWVAKNSEFDRNKFQRKKARKIMEEIVYFISPEDLILSKLKWHAIGESMRQLEDIESILKISGEKLDMRYIKKWARKLEVIDTFNEVVKRSKKAHRLRRARDGSQ